MYPHDLKCPTSMMQPQPVGICDRCSEKRYLRDLIWQFQVSGINGQVNLRILVCRDRCLDNLAQFLRPVKIGPEPAPLPNARPPQYAAQNAGGQPPINTVSEILDD